MFDCKVCEKTSKTRHGLMQHVRFAHRIESKQYRSTYEGANFTCKKCGDPIRQPYTKPSTYELCWACFKESPEKIESALKNVANRRNYSGENNPNYRGKVTKVCPCGKKFTRRVSPSQENSRYHTYCSTSCKRKYAKSISSHVVYNGHKFRSTWEAAMAEHLDSLGLTWTYEPEAFSTPFGYYTPDFYVKETDLYLEVKGYFREDAANKYAFFSQTHMCILADKYYFQSVLKITDFKTLSKRWRPMPQKWTCDVTGKEIFLNPSYEPIKDKDGNPVTVQNKSMNSNGRLQVQSVPAIKYKQEKAYFLRLTVGDECLQLCLSAEGMAKYKTAAKNLFDAMAAELEPK